MRKRAWISIIIIIGLILSLCPTTGVYAEEQKRAVITVENESAVPGETVEISVRIQNNPGIVGAILKISYDTKLELVNSKAGSAFADLSITKPGKYTSPCQFMWDAVDSTVDSAKDGDILVLSFKVPENAEIGTEYDVCVSSMTGDIINASLKPVDTEMINGCVSVVSNYIPGDVNSDEKVNSTDVVLVRRFIAGGYNVSIKEDAGDVNADGRINATDVVLMRRYIAGGYLDENGNPLVLHAGKVEQGKCNHNMMAYPYKAPTCTEKGNISYWYCENCKKCFSDELGTSEISDDMIVIVENGHVPVIDPAVPATANSPGLTEGSHCDVCKKVLVPQEQISSNMFEIKYNVANGDSYLSKLDIENPNKKVIEEGKTLHLSDLDVAGYRFLGWYDGAGDNAERIKEIENADHSMTLYAHWELIPYTIQFMSDLVPEEAITYTTKEGKILPTPTLDGYTFVGWTDIRGNQYSQIKSGTTEDIILYANWISDRNKAWAKKKIESPSMIYDDGEIILFVYEIGEIRDVPIYEIENFGKINKDGVPLTVKKKYSTKTEETLMNSLAKTVDKATTSSSEWTLSSGWSDSVAVNKEWCEQHNISLEEAESIGKNESGNWYVSNSSGGSNSVTVSDSTDSYDLHTKTNNTHSWSKDYQERVEHDPSIKVEKKDAFSLKGSMTGSLGINLGISGSLSGIPASAGLNSSLGVGGEVSKEWEDTIDVSKQGADSTTMKGKVFDNGGSSQSGEIKHHSIGSTSTSEWNTESGYGGSTSTSKNKSISSAVSQLLSEKTDYGKSYISTNEDSKTQGQVEYSADSEAYSSAVTYSTITAEEVEVEYTTTNTKTGYHRWVMAGTAHVFGIVGYDIATKSYFVNTYSIMDDEMHRFEDYSYNTSSYDDNQNGVIPFEIPTDIAGYVNDRVFASEGLEINNEGMITAYTGDDTYVIIPDYIPVDNQDNSTTVIRVNGISETAFRGNEKITGIRLSRYIDCIPDNAFRGCKNLWEVDASVSSVGRNAFMDCPLLSEWNVSTAIKDLGENAFQGAEKLNIKAANSTVVKNAIVSGAKDITIGLDKISDSLDGVTLTVPSTVDSIAFNAYGGTYKDTCIKSDAGKTILNRMNIESSGSIPLQISSSEIQLNQCRITNNGICATFTADDLTLDLYGPSSIESQGTNALFCRNTNVIRTTSGLATSLSLTGNLVVCGDVVDDKKLVTFTKGEIIKVDEDTFENMLKAYRLIFDANGGICSTESKTVENGAQVGDLPIPTRTGYDFLGWHREDDDSLVTKESKYSEGKDLTLVAQWKVKEFTVDWNTVIGCDINVTRTSSPYQNAPLEKLNSGDTVYYGDNLSISYAENEGYMIGKKGKTSVTVYGNVTSTDIYAEVGKLSDGWVKESEMPTGAQVIDEKWEYDKVTNIESDVKDVEGYTLYDESYIWSDWGPYSPWSNTKVEASESRHVDTRDIPATYKTQYHYDRYYGYNGSWYISWYTYQSSCPKKEETNWLDSPLPRETDCAGVEYAYGRTYNENGVSVTTRKSGSRYDIYWFNEQTRSVQDTAAYTQYRYRDRTKIYTYYLTKREHFESKDRVNESDGIENVQRMVKYVVY